MTPERAQRLEQLHRSLLKAEEQALHAAREAATAAQFTLAALTRQKEEAALRRNGSMTGTEWRLWQAYVEALEARAAEQQRQADGLAQQVEDRLHATLAAQREVRRWTRLVEATRTDVHRKEQRASQWLLDEFATSRWPQRRGVTS
jgi:flagellar export protein FliJ